MGRYADRIAKEKAETASAQLTKALRALLDPLRLEQTDLRGLDEPRSVHVCKKPWQETERQEVCFISIKQAPQRPTKPHRGVRIGGGYHLTELKGQYKKSKNGIDVQPELIDKETGEVIDGIESGQPYFLYAESGDTDTFAKGKVPPERMHYKGGGFENEFHFGTYNRGEARTPYGDRKECRGLKEYDKSVGPDVRDCASFRVLSSERRRAARQSKENVAPQGSCQMSEDNESMEQDSHEGARTETGVTRQTSGACTFNQTGEIAGKIVATGEAGRQEVGRVGTGGEELPLGPAPPSLTTSEVPLEARTEQALEALLNAMGLSRKSTVEEAPGKGKQASVSCTKCRVADQWSVEMCYICMDDIIERVIEHVVEKEVIVERIVEKLVEVEVPVVRTVKEICTVEVPVERIVEKEVRVEVPCYIEVEKPPTRTIGTQTEEEPTCPFCGKVKSAHPEGEFPCPTCHVCGKVKSAHEPGKFPCQPPTQAQEIFAPKARKVLKENIGAVRVGGGFEVVGSVPDVLKKSALNDIEAQRVLASTKGDTMQRMAGVQDVVSRRSLDSTKAQAFVAGPRSTVQDCKEVYGLVRSSGPERTRGIHQSQEALLKEINIGGKAPPAPAGHVFGTFLRGSQEKQRFGHDRGSRTPFRVYRSRVTAEDASNVAPVLKRSHSQPAIRRPASAGPHRNSGPKSQERGPSPPRAVQTLEDASISAIEAELVQRAGLGGFASMSAIEAATTASFSALGLLRSSGSESASLSATMPGGAQQEVKHRFDYSTGGS